MSFAETAGATALDVVAVVLLGWTTRSAIGDRERPSAGPFVAVLAVLTAWAVFVLVSEFPLPSTELPVESLLEFGRIACALAAPGAWTIYALGYTGRGTGLTRRRLLMLAGIAAPALVGLLVMAAVPSRAVVRRTVTSVRIIELVYLSGLFVYATYLLVGLSRTHTRVSKLQVAILTTGVAAPYAVATAWDGGTVADSATVSLLLSGGLLAVAVRQYPVLTGFPKADYVARTRVVEALREAVLVLDWDDYVLDANETTVTLFDASADRIVGKPLRAVVDGFDGEDLAPGATGTVTLRTSKGHRQFQYSVSPVDVAGAPDGTRADPVARALLLRDVTDRQTREQRLTVLNRVLRHNVRNKVDVVLAHAELVDDEELRSTIRASVADLLELSNKARAAEEMMTESTEPPEPVDLAAVATEVVEEHRDDHPGSDISLSSPAELRVPTRRAVVRAVLSELLDNALTHADSPSVEVSVRERSGVAAELAVADDGPGIPERELEILDDGTETQLQHGQGIGLWFVNWAVTQLGGDLAFEENEPDGSVVTVTLHGGTTGS